ncbi:hypothetical protein VK90_09070 [Bacillus sp. LK2]|nr:hypothetical protein VK90_09070 [Bacillus sp. LK2]
MRRIYFIGLILYTLIVLHVAFPEIFSFENVTTIHIAIFIFTLFVVDCCISLWISSKKEVQEVKDKKEIERKNRNVHWSLSCIYSKICEMKNTKPMWTWCFIYPALTGSKTPTSKFGECEGVRWEINCP